MTCECCQCGHCVHAHHRPLFIPYHRPPSPPLPANTLILPSTASVLDVPLRFTTSKRSFSISSNSTSPALLDALHWSEEGDAAGDEDAKRLKSTGQRAVLSMSLASTASAASSTSAASAAATTDSSHCTCRCHASDSSHHTEPAEDRPQTTSGVGVASTVMAITVPHSTSSSKRSRTVDGRPLSSSSSTTTRSARPRADTSSSPPQPPTSLPLHHTDLHHEEEPDIEAEMEGQLRRSELSDRPNSAAAQWAEDRARRERLTQQYEAAAERRKQQVRADDVYYAVTLRKQWERRVRMEWYQARAERERVARGRMKSEGKIARELSNDAAAEMQGRPVFLDFGGCNARPAVQSERMKTHNITPDVSTPTAERERREVGDGRSGSLTESLYSGCVCCSGCSCHHTTLRSLSRTPARVSLR